MVLALVLGGVVAALHVGKVPPALGLLRADLNLDLVAAGFVVSTFNVLGMTLGLLAGVVADRLGRRRLILLGLGALVLGGVGGAASSGLAALLASRLLEGLGFMAVAVSSPALVLAASARRSRALTLSLWSVFMPVGMALAMALSPAVLDAIGWRGLWLGMAGGALVCAGLLARATAEPAATTQPARSRPAPSWHVLRDSVTRPALLLLGFTFGAYAFQWIAVMVWLPTFLPQALGVQGPTAALLSALVVVLNAPGNMAGGWLLRRGVAASRLVVLSSLAMALCATGLFLPLLADGARFALVLAFSFTGGLIPAALFSTVPAEAPSPRHLAAANGILLQGSNLGQFLGPPTVAAAVTAAGGAWQGALPPVLLAAALCAGAGVLGGRLPPPDPAATEHGG